MLAAISPTIIGWIFIAIGLLVIALAWRTRLRAQNAQTWPMIPGHVVRSWVGSRRRKKGHTSYYVAVEYTYRVADRDYTCKRVSFAGSPIFTSRSTADDVARTRYPAGMNVNVYYNPQNPSQAILDKRVPSMFAGIFIAIVFATIGTFIVLGKF